MNENLIQPSEDKKRNRKKRIIFDYLNIFKTKSVDYWIQVENF